ncbi:hypothetical protein [Methanosarcina barkeri]|uniref:hypothetical protein n=1 Tax=Methanosarcina barkeri TaxID=2208 RepID=UPI000A76D1D6|nr:hypothetical protein [Methanosarcina barkeri]
MKEAATGMKKKMLVLFQEKRQAILQKKAKTPEFTIICGAISLLAVLYIMELNKR